MSLCESICSGKKLGKDVIVGLTEPLERVDVLVLNGMAQHIAGNYVSEFVNQSGDKIVVIADYILSNNLEGLYAMYSGGFDVYSRGGKSPEQMLTELKSGRIEVDEKRANTYNVVFAVMIHVADTLIQHYAAFANS